jgi:hypothetical protein
MYRLSLDVSTGFCGLHHVRPQKRNAVAPPPLQIQMKTLLAIITTATLAGCATTNVSEFKAPDGTSIKKVKCTSEPAKCFALASESCPNGGTYRVMSSQSNSGGIVADLIPGPITWYSMTYACGQPDGRMPDFKFVGQQYIPPPPPPPPAPRQSTNTNCVAIGNTMNCTTN